MKIRELIFQGRDRLTVAHVQCADPLSHMKQIVEHCLGIDTSGLYVAWENEMAADKVKAVEAFLERRMKGEPFQYIAGCEYFWKSRFSVGPGVLIPRRETEWVVEALLELEPRQKARFSELGAGSGNIGLSLLLDRPQWEWFGYELNPETIPYLEANRKSLLAPGSVYHIESGDFFQKAGADAPFDWIVSNAPYVTSGEMPGLAKEIHHEPAMALDGGQDGLDVIRKLVQSAAKWLRPGGGIVGEMSGEQGPAVQKLLKDFGFEQSRVIRDYSGHDRVFVGRWGGK